MRRRLPLYAALSAVAICVEWLIYRATGAQGLLLASGVVIGAVVDAVVIASVQSDIDGTSAQEMWSRVLERLWAVVIVNFIFSFISFFGVELAAAGDLMDRILSIPVLLIGVGTVFAEVVAVVSDEDPWWFLVVRAFGSSIRTAWTGNTLWRAIVLFLLQFVPFIVGSTLEPALTHNHVAIASFWSNVPLGILFSIPLDVLIVLAFFDASGYEPKRTCGE